jgi:hypothetical protein
MRARGTSLVIAAGLALLVVFLLHQDRGLKGTPPPAPLHPVEATSPLEITVRCPIESDHFNTKGWQSASDPRPKAVVLVLIKNISTRAIVLPHFTYWMPGLTFSTHSPYVRNPKFFFAPIGQIDWVLLQPGKSIVAYDDAADYLTFLASGTYDLNYSVLIDYYYFEGPGETAKEHALMESRREADYTAQAQGTLSVRIASNQVSSR